MTGTGGGTEVFLVSNWPANKTRGKKGTMPGVADRKQGAWLNDKLSDWGGGGGEEGDGRLSI